MKRKQLVIIPCILLLFFGLYSVPFPHSVQAKLPAVAYRDSEVEQSTPYVLTINGWRLDCLFKRSFMTGEISLTSSEEAIGEQVRFEGQVFPLGPSEELGNVEFVTIMAYDKHLNRYAGSTLFFSTKEGSFLLYHPPYDTIYIAPAAEDKEAVSIIDYYRSYITWPL